MTLSNIYRPIWSELQAAEKLLAQELALRDGLLGEMTRYISQMPGKRIRPALALLGASLTSARKGVTRNEKAVRLAAAVEMIHTATLLHDDVIDGASLRRGLVTLNAKWGDTLSVLSGDYLYSRAFCLLSDLKDQRVLQLMSNTARIVCEGEVTQIQHQYDLTLSRERYLQVIEWKTASLMSASTQSGGLLGGASLKEAEGLREFGLNFGLAFQIMDDTQDLVGSEVAQGKSLGTDLGQGQLTLPLIYLRDAGGPETKEHLKLWFSTNGNGASRALSTEELLTRLKEAALQHEVPAYCRKVAHRYLSKARKAIAIFPDSPSKTSLLALTEYLPG